MSADRSVADVHMVLANDKLLKALITLLALKDENLLGELQTIFELAAAEGSKIGQASAPTWAHLGKELDLIADLVKAEDHVLDGAGQA